MDSTMKVLLKLAIIQGLFCCFTFAWRPEQLKFTKNEAVKDIEFPLDNFQGLFHALSMKRLQEGVLTADDMGFECLNDTEKVIEDLHKLEYALRFLDADVKIPYGILQGQILWTGDYNECLNIVSPYNKFTKHTFKGRYFTVKGSTLYLGVCLPDSCNKNDALVLMRMLSESFTTVLTSDRKTADASDIAGIAICSLIVLVVIVGTAVDLVLIHFRNGSDEGNLVNGYRKFQNDELNGNAGILSDDNLMVEKPPEPSIPVKILRSFSFFANTRKLVNTKTATGCLACLNGIRVISMFWVIQGHSYGFAVSGLKDPLYAETTLSQRFSFQAILNGTYSVDSFFFLSGLLVAFLAMKELSEKGRINWIYYFVHRYWRLTPTYAICLMFFTTIWTLLITGPFQWAALDPIGPYHPSVYECRKYWWSNLLYINNLYPNYGKETNCFGWAWYLANDMQFYMVLSPIIILLLHKTQIIGILFSIFLIIGGVVSRVVTALYYDMDYEGQITRHENDPWAVGGPLYTKPYARWSVYVIGMLTGYFLQRRKCVLRMNKIMTIGGWCVAIAMGMAVVYGLNYYHRHPGLPMPKFGTIFYLSSARTGWGLALSWTVIACTTGNGGWINKILSWKFWAPLGRLTYAAYLVHPMVIFGYYLNMVAPVQFTDMTMIYIFVSNLVLSYGVAYVVSMMIETPMMTIEKIVLGKA